jgi:hypothetical protein
MKETGHRPQGSHSLLPNLGRHCPEGGDSHSNQHSRKANFDHKQVLHRPNHRATRLRYDACGHNLRQGTEAPDSRVAWLSNNVPLSPKS